MSIATEEREWLDSMDAEEVGELLREVVEYDENAQCADGCEVEPDGRCPHGYSSILLLMGMI